MRVAVGCGDDAGSTSDLCREVAAVDTSVEDYGVGRTGEVGAEPADAADVYARRSVAGIAAVFGREGGFVGQAVEYDAFAGEGEPECRSRCLSRL